MAKLLKRLALACVLAGSLAGVSATLDSAQALPVALDRTQAAAGDLATPVQYDPYGYRYARPYRYRYGYRPYYRGRAGVYQCGPYAFKTHLSRKYCR